VNSERALVARVREDLRAAGYPLVLTDMRLPTMHKDRRLDVVAFAADSTDALQPTVVVEVKHRADADPQLVLDQLALARDILGTRRHYLVTPDGWLEADGGLRRLQQVDGPAEPNRPGGELRDISTAELLVQQDLWAESNRHRNEAGPDSALRAVRNMLVHFAGPAAVLADQTVPMNPAARWHAVRDVVRRHLVRDRNLEPLLSQPALAQPLAQLLGDVVPARVEDPFAGLGAFLWAVADRAIEANTVVQLSGTDVNISVVELASAVGALCPMPLQFRVGDSFRAQDSEPVDAVLTQPPLGLRLPDPFQLSSGASTRDGELAAIDVALSRLKPGARAVLHISRGWTFRGGDAARYRAYLAANWRVAALIGLPTGVYAGTNIPSTILVVDRGHPGDTFVANLEANWAEELAPGGTVLSECLKHLDAPYLLGGGGGRGE
jgi:hypothetical protein